MLVVITSAPYCTLLWFCCLATIFASSDLESQLYEDLLYSYNKIVRPVQNSSDILTVNVGAALIRIIDVDEKKQVLTTNLWLEMNWYDSKLIWNPAKYGGLKKLHIPSELIWTPDLVLYNNAAGDPDITINTDALVSYDGRVFWQPPAIYKSFCPIDVTWFPYDMQNCDMKFGTWTYTGFYVDLRLLPREQVVIENGIERMERGMDLSYFYKSAEWDLLSLGSERHAVLYASCCGPEKYVDITYSFSMRRRTLFFTCNLIIPCFLISFLTTFVFYLSDHKITFAISILVTLTVFFLVLIDIIPPTSVVLPMFGRYLITTMVLVAASIIISVVTTNFHFRSGDTHHMPNCVRLIFLRFLPRILLMDRPPGIDQEVDNFDNDIVAADRLNILPTSYIYALNESPLVTRKEESSGEREKRLHKQIILRVLQKVRFVSDHFREIEREAKYSSDWTFVAMVIDRLFLVIFAILNVSTLLIILKAPSLYHTDRPLNISSASKPLGQGNLFDLLDETFV